ncbi:hypothetical protein [Amorphus sp. 3PC139-8]|uniref:hypothetical protein n=1 Tax=Amorphus sp. 3PC139-8 TaxID=2735676 RepID=UPI00345DC5F5
MVLLAGPRFFKTLCDVARDHLGEAGARAAGFEAAIEADDGVATARAQDALSGLEPEMRERILAATHKRLREDPESILQHWTPPHSLPQ